MNTDDVLLTSAQAAERLGIASATWRSYVSKGYAPAADDPGDLTQPVNRRAPRWLTSTVDTYRQSRPGRGARTDQKRDRDGDNAAA